MGISRWKTDTRPYAPLVPLEYILSPEEYYFYTAHDVGYLASGINPELGGSKVEKSRNIINKIEKYILHYKRQES